MAKTEEEVEALIEATTEFVGGALDDMAFTQAQAVEMYRAVGEFCQSRAQTIQSEMNEGDG